MEPNDDSVEPNDCSMEPNDCSMELNDCSIELNDCSIELNDCSTQLTDCSHECADSDDCVGFNYNEPQIVCDLFQTSFTTLSLTSGCTYYEASRDVQGGAKTGPTYLIANISKTP